MLATETTMCALAAQPAGRARAVWRSQSVRCARSCGGSAVCKRGDGGRRSRSAVPLPVGLGVSRARQGPLGPSRALLKLALPPGNVHVGGFAAGASGTRVTRLCCPLAPARGSFHSRAGWRCCEALSRPELLRRKTSATMQQRVVLVRQCGSEGATSRSHAHAVRARLSQVNSFVIDTAHMLNRFASQAERTMERVDECVRPDKARLCCCARLTSIAGSCRASRPRLRCWKPGLKGAHRTRPLPRLQALTR